MAKGVFIRRGNGIFATDDDSVAMIRALPDNKPFMGEFKGARNPEQHKLWWGLMTFLAEHRDDLFKGGKDEACEQLKLDTGHFDRVLNVRTGELREVTRSIAFESLAQKEFDEFFQRACDVICQDYMPGLQTEGLRQEMYKMILGKNAPTFGRA